MTIYVVIFALISFFALEYEVGKTKSIWPLFALGVLLALLAGFRAPEISRDYLLYQLAFDYIDNPSLATGDIQAVYEPGFTALIYFFKGIFSRQYTLALMLFFALVSVTLTVIAIRKYPVNPYLALLIFYSGFFFLHEMTQIRIGLAISILLVSIPYYIRGKYLIFSAFIILAGLFHYSAFLLFSILLLRRDQFSKIFFATILVLSIPLGLLKLKIFNIFSLLSAIDSSNTKFSSYADMAILELTTQANIFNVSNLFNILLSGYLLWVVSAEDLKNDKYLSFFLKSNIISIFLFCFASANALIAFRISELFGIASVFLFPYLNRYLPFKRFNTWFVILVGLVFFFVNVIYGDLVKPYRIYNVYR